MKTLHMRGFVFSGVSEGSKFLELEWVKKQIKEKLGFNPYPGTLNLKLRKEELKHIVQLKKAVAIEISPAAGFCRGRCYRANLAGNLKCAIILPEVEDYPEDVVEIIAPINLREKLNLKDNDSVEVRVPLG